MVKEGLSERDLLFCREYARCYNGTQAAKAAGYGVRKDGSYNEKSARQAAYRRLKREDIKAEIDRLLKNAANESGATPLYITEQLKAIADRCMQEVSPELVFDSGERKMVETGDYVFNARDAVSALKALADIQGLKSEKLRLGNITDDKNLNITMTVVE